MVYETRRGEEDIMFILLMPANPEMDYDVSEYRELRSNTHILPCLIVTDMKMEWGD